MKLIGIIRHWIWKRTGMWMHPLCLKLWNHSCPDSVSELIEAMQRYVPVGLGTMDSLSVTGEEYLEFCIGQHLVWDQKLLCHVMWRTFCKQVFKSTDPSSLVLYWRVLPEMSEYDGKRKLYARFLLSSKAQIRNSSTPFLFAGDLR